MIIHNVKQGTEEWLDLRRGIPTASEVSKILTGKTMKPATSLKAYAIELAFELKGIYSEGFKSAAMRDGNDLEDSVRTRYSFFHEPIEEVGFVTTDDSKFGYSPDGFTKNSIVEIKSPILKTFFNWLSKDEIPSEHLAQCQSGLFACEGEKESCIFIAQAAIHDDHLRSESPLLIKELFPDLKYHKLLAEQLAVVYGIRDAFFIEKLGGKL